MAPRDLLHIAIGLADGDLDPRPLVITDGGLRQVLDQPLFLFQPVRVEIADQQLDRGRLHAGVDDVGVHEALVALGRLG